MAAVRKCRVSLTDAEGITHFVEVHGTTVYEVAATALAQLRQERWVAAIGPTAVLQIEVLVPPTIHSVPLKALQRWAEAPSASPREELLKRPLRRS